MSNHVLQMEDVHKSFWQGKHELKVLQGASLDIRKGEMIALIGESGCGKSTLLQIAGLLERFDSGEVKINGKAVHSLSDRKQTKIRRNDIGFIYQFHHLLPDFTALENVMMPQIIARKSKSKAKKRAEELLTKLGLDMRLKHRPSQLSGGEQQRVAIARALASEPKLLLADEPTGNLDPETSDSVFDILVEMVVESGLSMLVVTHNTELARKTDRVLTLNEGKIVPLKQSDS